MKLLFNAVLSGGMGISAAMIVVWVVRSKTVGARAWVMAVAFVAVGGLCASLRLAAPQWVAVVFGGSLAALLVTDVVMRLSEQGQNQP